MATVQEAVAVRTAEAQLPYHPKSASLARGLVRNALIGWGLGGLVEDALLIVSELVGNAAKTGCQLKMRVTITLITDTSVRIEVTDGSRAMPVRIDAGPDALGGRGLDLVHKLTRGHWGATLLVNGKTLHADLKLGSTP
ncbi:ATP-binding protein [Kitasatospora sp. NPDC028055]|uniref:ATP-binding protein n=1 Tax=Kitasatospora sp. NPDC028055 TaxID=3155653 RepID=UPI0033EBDFC1